jgi:hypothetical protein
MICQIEHGEPARRMLWLPRETRGQLAHGAQRTRRVQEMWR